MVKSKRRADTDNRRDLRVALIVLNVPMFVLGILHVMVVTSSAWAPPGLRGSLGPLWMLFYNLGPLGFACSLLLAGAVRWIGGFSNWQKVKPPAWVFVPAVAVLALIYATY